MLKQTFTVFTLLGVLFVLLGIGILWELQVLVVVASIFCFLAAIMMFSVALAALRWDKKVTSFKDHINKSIPFVSIFK